MYESESTFSDLQLPFFVVDFNFWKLIFLPIVRAKCGRRRIKDKLIENQLILIDNQKCSLKTKSLEF